MMVHCVVCVVVVALLCGPAHGAPPTPPPVIVVDATNGSVSQDCWVDGQEGGVTCRTLMSALEGVQAATGPVRIEIHPGNYHLGPDSNITIFTHASNVTLSGLSDEVVVNCNESSGLVFIDSTYIVVENISFSGCAIHQSLVEVNLTADLTAGLSFHSCTRVTLRSLKVRDTDGIGVLFYNTLGVNVIVSSTFTNNSCLSGGMYPAGGIVIILNFCGPLQEPDCSDQNEGGSYVIQDCMFEGNAATDMEHFENDTYSETFTSLISQGGGLSSYFLEDTTNVSISLESSNFTRNYAQHGGGLYSVFTDYAQGNSLSVLHCVFDSNNYHEDDQLPPASRGGGANIVVLADNIINFSDCTFTQNMALIGGACSFISATQHENKVPICITDSQFFNNTATLGAALEISFPDARRVYADVSYKITRGTFSSNTAIESRERPGQTPRVGFGGVYIYKANVEFWGNTSFSDNSGTALAIADSMVSIQTSASVTFENNQGVQGGALHVLSNGILVIFPQTSLTFEHNSAEQYGGAVYVGVREAHDFSSGHYCFLRYYEGSVHPNDWDTKITFHGNTAHKSHNSIWCASLSQCTKGNITETFCWKNWDYQNSACYDQVETAASKIVQRHSDRYCFPGRYRQLPITLLDDLGHDVTDSVVLTVLVTEGEGAVRYDDLHVNADSSFPIYGTPNSTLTLNLQTSGIAALTEEIEMGILPCPPGFVPEPLNLTHSDLPPSSTQECVCSSRHNEYLTCSNSDFTVTLQSGSGISYDDELGTVFVGHTPYCVFKNISLILPTNVSELNDQLCGDLHRTGLLCGKCEPGYSHSITFADNRCINCTTSLVYSWLYATAALLVPTTILYFIVTLFDINATSAGLNGYIFFCQVTSFPLRNQIVWMWFTAIPFSNTLIRFLEAYPYFTIPYTLWNLDFQVLNTFRQDNMCLIRGGSAMAHISLEYVVAVYPLVFIAINYLLVELYAHNFRLIVWIWKPFRVCFLRFKRTWNPRHCMINAFATFIIISYVRFLTTSLELLTFTTLWDTYNKTSQAVFYYDASVLWLGSEHLPYAILAIIMLCVFVVMPPVLLLLYPLKIFQMGMNKCRCVRWQGFRTLMDTFQGCFKDGTEDTRDYRYFAGLYLLFRILLIVIYATVPHIYFKYLALNVFYVIALPLFVMLRPYRQDFYNYLDTGIFGLLSLIAILEFFNYHTILVDHTWIVTACLPFILFFIPLVCAVGYSVYWVVHKLVKKKCSSVRRRTFTESSGFPDRLLNPNRYSNLVNVSELNQDDQEDRDQEQEVPVVTSASTGSVKYGSLVTSMDESGKFADEAFSRSTEMLVLSSGK